MAEISDTQSCSNHISQIIKNADKKIILISPYLNICRRYKELLEEKDRDYIPGGIHIIYGKVELNPEESSWLKSLTSVKLRFCENLHAKCYMNEKEAVITSLNLYESSQVNNRELGVYFSRRDDSDLYSAAEREATRIITASKEVKDSVEKSTPKEQAAIKNVNRNKTLGNGFCIRCKKQIALDPEQPYCKDCYIVWKEFGNKEYLEKYCHICGKPNNSTLVRPICLACYKKKIV